MNEEIGHKVVKGTAWVVAGNLSLRGFSVGSTIVLAWLLKPSDFGIVAMAAIVTELMASTTEVGMSQVLVYRQDAEKSLYDTGWTIQFLRGLILSLGLSILAGFISGFFNEPRLETVLRVLSVVFLLDGLRSIGMARLLKDMRFDLEFRYRLLIRLVAITCAVGLAFWLRNYWAMVFSSVVAAIMGVTLSYWYAPHFAHPTLAGWRQILGFSQWVFLREGMSTLSMKLDQILLGRWLGTGQLGQYGLASDIAPLPTTEFALPLSRSLFPALATMQHQLERFRHLFHNSLAGAIAIALPAGCGLAMIGRLLSETFLSPEWDLVGPLIQILALYGILRMAFGLCISAYTALGRVRDLFYISLVSLFMKFGILYYGFLYAGIYGIAWGTVISGLLPLALYLWIAHRNDFLRFGILLNLIWRPIVASAIMVAALIGLQNLIGQMNWRPGLELTAMVTTGSILYPLTMLALWKAAGRPEGTEKNLLEFIFNRLGKRGIVSNGS